MRFEIAGVGDTWKTDIGDTVVEDMTVVRWPNGKVYVQYLVKDLVQLLAADMHKNIRDGYDNVVVVEGPEGSGKSNLAYAICKAYDQDFDVTKQYVYNTDAFKEKLNSGDDRHSVFWMDEGSNIANNRDWNTVDNKDLIGLLETCRSRGWTIVMCIPTHERLDVYIREHRIRYLLKCGPRKFDVSGYKERGYFELQKKSPWGKMETVGYGSYDKIPEEVKDTYEGIKADSQRKLIDQVINPEAPGSKYKAKYEAKCKETDDILLRLYDSKKCDKESLMQLFGIESEKTFENKIYKARRRANGED